MDIPEEIDGAESMVEGAAPTEAELEQLVALAHQCFDMAREGDRATLGAYVEAGVPVDLTDSAGNTLLMLAAYHGHAGLVGDLAGLGADVDRANDRGQTPLAGAVFKGEDEVVAALVEAGADPGAGSPTAYEAAAVFGRADLVEMLQRGGSKGGES